MKEGTIRVSSTQLKSETCKDDNIRKIEIYTKKASELQSDLIVYPESFMFYSPVEETADIRAVKAENIEGGFVTRIRELSRDYGISQIVGIHESIPGDKRVYNTVVVVDKKGEIATVYRKTHLYDAFNFRESLIYKASGNAFQIFELNGMKIGMMVCYEIRFPEIARYLTVQGADLIVVPSAWVRGFGKEEQWLTLIKARALENTVYMVTSNQIGNVYAGITSVVDPMGVIISRTSEDEGMVTVDISKERVEGVRRNLPSLSQRRTELYSITKG